MTVKTVKNDSVTARVSFGSINVAERRIFGERRMSPTQQAPTIRPQSEGSPKSNSSPTVAPCCHRRNFAIAYAAIPLQQASLIQSSDPLAGALALVIRSPGRTKEIENTPLPAAQGTAPGVSQVSVFPKCGVLDCGQRAATESPMRLAAGLWSCNRARAYSRRLRRLRAGGARSRAPRASAAARNGVRPPDEHDRPRERRAANRRSASGGATAAPRGSGALAIAE